MNLSIKLRRNPKQLAFRSFFSLTDIFTFAAGLPFAAPTAVDGRDDASTRVSSASESGPGVGSRGLGWDVCGGGEGGAGVRRAAAATAANSNVTFESMVKGY